MGLLVFLKIMLVAYNTVFNKEEQDEKLYTYDRRPCNNQDQVK